MRRWTADDARTGVRIGTAIVFAALTAAATPILREISKYRGEIHEVITAGMSPALQKAMTDGRITSLQLVDAYLARIRAYDHAGPALNTMIRLSPKARSDAARANADVAKAQAVLAKAGKTRSEAEGRAETNGRKIWSRAMKAAGLKSNHGNAGNANAAS